VPRSERRAISEHIASNELKRTARLVVLLRHDVQGSVSIIHVVNGDLLLGQPQTRGEQTLGHLGD
jgi:hypothetical protein